VNVKRFFGRTNKEALARLRAELGPDAIVLKNRAVEGGIEILAMAEDTRLPEPAPDTLAQADEPAASWEEPPALRERVIEPPAKPAAVPEMTTLSFQQYVRDRLARKGSAGEKAAAKAAADKVAAERAASDKAAADERAMAERAASERIASERAAVERAAVERAAAERAAAEQAAQEQAAEQAYLHRAATERATAERAAAADNAAAHRATVERTSRLDALATDPLALPELGGFDARSQRSLAGAAHRTAVSAAASRPPAAPAPSAGPSVSAEAIADALDDARESITEAVQHSVLTELRQMKSFIADQLETLSWYEGTRRQPVRSRLLRTLITAGFSPALSRALVNRVPDEVDDDQALVWAGKALARNLQCDTEGSLIDGGGIFALIGPTGVGKTTSTAKIAARFALKHGTQSIGLVTVDAYRIGGQDQLRSFGRMLGVPVHVAHDAASLADFLHLYMNKKLVLIDTAGIGQRDERVEELLASLSSNVVRKLLVVNAAAQVETQEEVVLAYRGAQAAGLIISKLDEAVRPAGALDCAIRHRMRVVGVADGQRVPEDWAWADAQTLVDRALAVQSSPAFELDDQMLGMMFAAPRGDATAAALRRSDV
jgi:flagellar biosynthesis protein FlhF